MSDAWDGRPESPERDGWYWLSHDEGAPEAWKWHAERQDFGTALEVGGPLTTHPAWRYLGPCASPSEIAALRAENARLREALAWIGGYAPIAQARHPVAGFSDAKALDYVRDHARASLSGSAAP